MLDKITILKVLLLITFTATVYIVWVFASYAYQLETENNTEIVYIQSSSQSSFRSSQKSISSIKSSQSSSSLNSSSSISSASTSSNSSSISSLPFPILDNNITLVKDIKLEVQKPDSEIQSIIKEAKTRPKQEVKISIELSSSSTVTNSSKIIE
jgi:hypothetical protein